MHRIDSHHHLWDLTVRPQTWQVGNKFDPVRRNFDISDLKSAISDTGITHTYLVQTVMNYDETPELLVTANENEIILDRKSTRLNSSHTDISRMPSSA